MEEKAPEKPSAMGELGAVQHIEHVGRESAAHPALSWHNLVFPGVLAA
jgi:hypothetical protein